MHFHRAKYVPKGGPDGGDGGRGGHIILRGNRNLWTLLHLKYQKHIFATDGGKGGPSRSFGKDGEDKIIVVPCLREVSMQKGMNSALQTAKGALPPRQLQ